MAKKQTDNLPGDSFFRVIDTLRQLHHDARAMIVTTHAYLELMVDALVQKHCKRAKAISDGYTAYSYSVRLTILYEKGIVSEETFTRLHTFCKLRDKAVHHGHFDVTLAELQKLSPGFNDLAKLPMLMENIIGLFYNEHVELFAPLLLSSMLGTKDGSTVYLGDPYDTTNA